MTQYFTAVQERPSTHVQSRSSLKTETYTSARAHYKHCDTITTIPQALSLWRHCHYGGRGIRTPGAVNPAVFKTAAIVHSAIPPKFFSTGLTAPFSSFPLPHGNEQNRRNQQRNRSNPIHINRSHKEYP